MDFIWRISYAIWRGAQKNEWTFRFVLWLRENGATLAVKRWLTRHRDIKLRKHPDEGMMKSREFYEENRERTDRMLRLLSDEKSKKVWGGVIAYRTTREPLTPDLYSWDDQYFVRDIVRVEDGEVFVDGGAYVGDTIGSFLKVAKEEKANVKRIIALEPDEMNFRMLKRAYGDDPRVELVQKGMAKQSGTLMFRENANASCLTGDESLATTRVEVTAIDDLPQSEEITWIKMDIEGAESDALEGGRRTIQRNHPKLTICIYHSNEDMIRIAEQVHEMVPEYRIYVRHHTTSGNETVLYAVVQP